MKRTKLLCVLGLLLVTFGVAWVTWKCQPQEPSYQGKTLSEWLDTRYWNYAAWPGQAAADDAVRHMGTNAVPWLLKRLYRPRPKDSTTLEPVDTTLRRRVLIWLGAHGLRRYS